MTIPDMDVDNLANRATRIMAEIADLAAEAIRVRDQHAAQIDAMKRAYALSVAVSAAWQTRALDAEARLPATLPSPSPSPSQFFSCPHGQADGVFCGSCFAGG